MRLEVVQIDDYGPFVGSLQFGNGLDVVYGPNESGKTLLVDALLLILAGKNGDDRVGQNPVGFVRIQEGDGSRRLEENETVLDRLEAQTGLSLGAREFRNTFVVRSADSRLTEEDEFYDRATDVVAESMVDDIDRVRDAVRGAGRITPTGILIDRSTETETRTHHDTAKALGNEIEEFVTNTREAGVHTLEARLFETEQQVTEKLAEVDRLEAAKRQQSYQELAANRDELAMTLEEIGTYPDEDDLGTLAGAVDTAMESTDQVGDIESRRRDAQANTKRAVAVIAVAIVGSLGVGGLVLSSLGPSLLGYIAVALVTVLVAGIPGVAGMYFWQQRQAAESELAEVQATRTTSLQRGRELEIGADNLEALAMLVADQQRQLDTLHESAMTLHGELRGTLDLATDTAESTLEEATAELKQRESEFDEGEETEYTPGALDEAQSSLQELRNRREDLREQLEQSRDEIAAFVDDVNELPFAEYDLEPPPAEIESLDGLEVLSDCLNELIATIETDADNARAVDAVLEGLKEDEQRRVGELFFGTESTVSAYFSTITDGRYESVHYDEGENELRVRMVDGSELEPDQLSQSTFDQLYFAVRLAFAQELLSDQPGFLLLDDAFLAADSSRLSRQVEILADIVADGWQVLYFTAQEFHREQLVGGGSAEVHRLEPLG